MRAGVQKYTPSIFTPRLDQSCKLFLPLWHPNCKALNTATFKSLDRTATLMTVEGATWGTSGYTFDSTDDDIYGPTTALNSLPTATVLMRVKFLDLTVFNGDIGGKNIYQNGGFILRGSQNGVARFTCYLNDGSVKGGSGGTTVENVWTTVAVDWATPNVRTWLNGAYDATIVNNLGAFPNTTNRFYVGMNVGDDYHGAAVISDVLVFDRVLTASEHMRLHQVLNRRSD